MTPAMINDQEGHPELVRILNHVDKMLDLPSPEHYVLVGLSKANIKRLSKVVKELGKEGLDNFIDPPSSEWCTELLKRKPEVIMLLQFVMHQHYYLSQMKAQRFN